MKLLLLTLIMCISINLNAQEIDISFFEGNDNLKSWMNHQITAKDNRHIQWKINEAPKALVKIEIDKEGQILSLEFLEQSSLLAYNKMVERLVRLTSGKWKVAYEPNKSDRYFVIIPFVQMVWFMDNTKAEAQGFDEQYRQSKIIYSDLNKLDFNFCNGNSCLVTEPVTSVVSTGIE